MLFAGVGCSNVNIFNGLGNSWAQQAWMNGWGIGLGVGASWFFTNLFGPLGLLDFRLSACCITYMYILNKQEKVVYSFAS